MEICPPDVLVDENVETGEVDEGDDSCEEEPSPVHITHHVHRIQPNTNWYSLNIEEYDICQWPFPNPIYNLK